MRKNFFPWWFFFSCTCHQRVSLNTRLCGKSSENYGLPVSLWIYLRTLHQYMKITSVAGCWDNCDTAVSKNEVIHNSGTEANVIARATAYYLYSPSIGYFASQIALPKNSNVIIIWKKCHLTISTQSKFYITFSNES